MEILEEKNNQLFDRKEIKLKLKSEASLSNEDAKKTIAEKFSVNPENIKINKIEGKFGSRNFTISAEIYKQKVEEKNAKKNRKKGKKAPQEQTNK